MTFALEGLTVRMQPRRDKSVVRRWKTNQPAGQKGISVLLIESATHSGPREQHSCRRTVSDLARSFVASCTREQPPAPSKPYVRRMTAAEASATHPRLENARPSSVMDFLTSLAGLCCEGPDR